MPQYMGWNNKISKEIQFVMAGYVATRAVAQFSFMSDRGALQKGCKEIV